MASFSRSITFFGVGSRAIMSLLIKFVPKRVCRDCAGKIFGNASVPLKWIAQKRRGLYL
jgi:hypothetical protein